MKCDLTKMSLKEYMQWIKTPESREASLPEFFGAGVARTKNILKGTASQKSLIKWRSFGARHGKQFCVEPTRKRAIALRNWGYDVKIPK